MAQVTVVITTYNLEEYIAVCMDDLFVQTFQGFEILIVDDHSTDNTVGIINDYIVRYPGRIQMIALENNSGGPAKPRNAALDCGLIFGKYIIFLDGDDRIETDYIEILLETIEQGQSDVAVCAYDRIESETGHVLCHELTWLGGDIYLPPQDDSVAFLNPAVWNKIFRAAAITEIRFPNIIGAEDILFMLSVYQKCYKITTTARELIHYQVRQGSLISRTDEIMIHAFAEEFNKFYLSASAEWKEVIALSSFLHIGLSMATRAADNPDIQQDKYLKWTRQYMTETYDIYHNTRFFRFGSFRRYGVKGFILWCSLVLYRIGGFGIALWTYNAIRRTFQIDIKF